MVQIVCLGAGQERQMIAWVVVEGHERGQGEPGPRGDDMTPEDQQSRHNGQ